MSPDFPALKEIISFIRANCSDVKIIVGGVIITAEHEFIIRHLDMDYGCVGYGEDTICEFAECLENNGDFSKINGLIYKNKHGELVINPRRLQPKSLDEIPFPALEMFGFTGGNMWLSIMGARSCINNCTFCFRPNGYKYMERSLDNIFLEIDYWREKFQITRIAFRDELFAKDKKKAIEFCSRIKEYNMSYSIFLRVDIVTEKLIEALAESGCIAIFYGIESMNQKVLNNMRKNITVEQIEYAFRVTSKYNIMPFGNLIFGDPVETYDMAKESQDWWIKNPQYVVHLDMIIPFPGSALYKHGVKAGRIKDKLSFLEGGCEVINLSAISEAEFAKLQWQNKCLWNSRRPTINLRYETLDDDKILVCGDCPYCGTINYTNFYNGGFSAYAIYEQSCTECNSKLTFEFKYIHNIFDIRYFNEFNFKNKRIAIWGLSEKAKFRIATNKDMRKSVVVIVDRNYHSFKDKFLSFEVQSPKMLSKTDFDVLYIGSSIARENILNMAREIVGSEFYKKEIMLMD